MKREIKTNTGLIAIFAAAVIIFGGAYTWANLNPPVEVDYISNEPIIFSANKSKASYANSDFKFRLDYPKDWNDSLKETKSPEDLSENDLVFKVEVEDLENKFIIDCVNNEFQSWRETTPSAEQCSPVLSGLSLAAKERYLGPRHPKNIFLKVFKNSDGLDLTTWLEKKYKKENTELANYEVGERITLGNTPGFISSIGCCGNYDKSYVVSRGDLIYMLGTNSFEGLTDRNIPVYLLGAIDSFKFIN